MCNYIFFNFIAVCCFYRYGKSNKTRYGSLLRQQIVMADCYGNKLLWQFYIMYKKIIKKYT